MTDHTGNPPGNDVESGGQPPKRPMFPAASVPAAPITPPAVVSPVAPVTPAPPVPPPVVVPAPAVVVPAPAVAPDVVSPAPAFSFASASPPAPPATYDEQVATASRVAHAGDRNPGRNPGKTLGIIGLVLAIPLSLVGLIFSILGLRKSKKAGSGNAIAWTGIVLSTLVILVSIAAGVFAFTVLQPQIALAQACADAGPGEYTDQNGNPVTCE